MTKQAPNELDNWRKQIDKVDYELILQVAKRMKLVKEVGIYKKTNSLPPLDQERWNQVLQNRMMLGEEQGISPELIHEIFEIIHQHALKLEEEIKL